MGSTQSTNERINAAKRPYEDHMETECLQLNGNRQRVTYVHQLFEKSKGFQNSKLHGAEVPSQNAGLPVKLPGLAFKNSRTPYVNRLQAARGVFWQHPVVTAERRESEDMSPPHKSADHAQKQLVLAGNRKSSISVTQQNSGRVRTPTPAQRRLLKPPSMKFYHTHVKQRQPTPLKVPPLHPVGRLKTLKRESSQQRLLFGGSSESIKLSPRKKPVLKTRIINIQKRKRLEEISNRTSPKLLTIPGPTTENISTFNENIDLDQQRFSTIPLKGHTSESTNFQTEFWFKYDKAKCHPEQSIISLPQNSKYSAKGNVIGRNSIVELKRTSSPVSCKNESIEDFSLDLLFSQNEKKAHSEQGSTEYARTFPSEQPPPLPSIEELLETIQEANEKKNSSVSFSSAAHCRILNCDGLKVVDKYRDEMNPLSFEGKSDKSWKTESIRFCEVRDTCANKAGSNNDDESASIEDLLEEDWDTNSVTEYSTPLSSESSKSILTFDEAKQRIIEGKKKPLKKNLEYYKQLEELGLGYIKDGIWMPTGIVASHIWKNAEKNVESCEAKWVGKVNKSSHKI